MEKRILLVVRDKVMREHLAHALCGQGFCVTMASDGVSGLFQLGFRQPHLIVLDVCGWEILQRIRALSDVPVIVLIDDTPEERVESLDRGADFFLIKPPSASELDAKVRALLRRNSAMLSGRAALLERAQELTDLNAVLGA